MAPLPRQGPPVTLGGPINDLEITQGYATTDDRRDAHMLPQNRLEDGNRAPPSRSRVFCAIGETLCEVRVWTEEEWEALPPDRRPSPAEFLDGLGWVGAVVASARPSRG